MDSKAKVGSQELLLFGSVILCKFPGFGKGRWVGSEVERAAPTAPPAPGRARTCRPPPRRPLPRPARPASPARPPPSVRRCRLPSPALTQVGVPLPRAPGKGPRNPDPQPRAPLPKGPQDSRGAGGCWRPESLWLPGSGGGAAAGGSACGAPRGDKTETRISSGSSFQSCSREDLGQEPSRAGGGALSPALPPRSPSHLGPRGVRARVAGAPRAPGQVACAGCTGSWRPCPGGGRSWLASWPDPEGDGRGAAAAGAPAPRSGLASRSW